MSISDAVYAQVGQIMKTRTTAQWRELLDQADVPNMPMNSPADLIDNPQLRATGFVQEEVHPTEGTLRTLGHPTQWSQTPPARHLRPAPRLGEHTRAVLARAGYTASEIDTMLNNGACHDDT